MSDRWVSLAEAAAELGINSRRLRRRITAGEFRTRQHDGRREILFVDGRSPGGSGAGRTPESAARSVATRETAAPPDWAERQARAAGAGLAAQRQLIDFTRAQLAAARQSARIAWCTVAVLTCAGGYGLWWSTRAVTQAESEVGRLTGQIQGWSLQSQAMAGEIDRLQKALGRESRTAAAKEPRPIPSDGRHGASARRAASQALPAAPFAADSDGGEFEARVTSGPPSDDPS